MGQQWRCGAPVLWVLTKLSTSNTAENDVLLLARPAASGFEWRSERKHSTDAEREKVSGLQITTSQSVCLSQDLPYYTGIPE